MARNNRTARRRAAEQVPTRGVAQIAKDYGVTEPTVRRWCREFKVALPARRPQPAAAAVRKQPLTATQRNTLRHVVKAFDVETAWWATAGAFAPRVFSEQLARIASDHRPMEHPHKAVTGIASAAAALKDLCATHIKETGDNDSDAVRVHAHQLKAIVEACVTKAETRGPDGALHLLNNALTNWGATGVDPDRITQRGTAPIWEQRRHQAETAVEQLVPLLKAHPEHNWRHDAPQCSRHHNKVTVDVQFDKFGQEIFRTPGDLVAEDWDYPNLAGRGILIDMAKQAAEAAGLEIGAAAEIIVEPSEKGWVEVGFRIIDPDTPPQ